MKHAFIVQTLGYWGRGATINKAARQCCKAGAKAKSQVVVDLVLGDEEPAITNNGMTITHAADATVVRVGEDIKLSALLK